MRLQITDRGFVRADFADMDGSACSIQESSLATDYALWLGANGNRMHLDQETARELADLLIRFAETGRL